MHATNTHTHWHTHTHIWHGASKVDELAEASRSQPTDPLHSDARAEGGGDGEGEKDEAFFWVHTGRHALVRLLLRSEAVPDLRERLCLLAGTYI